MRVELNKDALLTFIAKENLSERRLAKQMGIAPATLSRVLNDQRNVGGEFIAKLLAVVGEGEFYQFFFLD